MARLSKVDLSIVVVSLVALGICLSNGLGFTYDSNLYLEGAKFLNRAELGDLFSHGVFKAKPPLFPAFVFALGGNLKLIALSNLVFHTASMVVSFFLINKIIVDQHLAVITKVATAFGTPIILVHEFFLPEPIFMLLWNLQLLLVLKIYERLSQKLLILLLVSSILLIGLRHIAIVLIFVSGVLVLNTTKNTRFKFLGVINLLVPLLLFFLWQFFIYKETKNFNRLDHFYGADVFTNAHLVLQSLSWWFIPLTGIPIFDTTIIITFVVVSIFLFYHALKQEKTLSSFKAFLAIQCWVFIGFIIVKKDLIFSDVERYLSIIYLPFLVLIISGVSESQNKRIVVAVTSIWLVYLLIRLLNNIPLWSGLF